ncbi:MAG TPA: hypothetical protein VJR89_23465 [Polyangiales bacterium]|nr:hypothetical protein [Polyangiales bacterium]
MDAGPPQLDRYPTSIVVENIGAEAIVLHPDCGAVWVEIRRGDEALDVTWYCKTMCDPPRHGGCPAICLTTDKLLVPGARKTFEWDGTFFQQQGTCHASEVPEQSTELTATVCWDALLPWSAAPECASASFEYGVATEVVVRAQREPVQPRTTTLQLTNRRDTPIEIIAEHCSSQGVFSTDVGTTSSLAPGCICSCNDAAPDGQCSLPACGTCAPDVVKVLQPGQAFEYEWDQHVWHRPVSTCSSEYALSPEDAVAMRACWRASPMAQVECAKRTVKSSDTRVAFEASP